MTHAHPGDPVCTGTWAITGNPCRHSPAGGLEVCAAHHPDGDKRRAAVAEEIRCTAATKESGERCRRMCVVGGRVCTVHGGAARQVREKAEARTQEAKVRELVKTYGRKIETTAVEALLDEVQWTAGHVAWLRERVQEIEEGALVEPVDAEPDGDEQATGPDAHPLVWGITKVKTGGDDRGVTREAAPNIWLRLYQTERSHLVKVCSEAVRAGLDERLVRLAEQRGALVAQAIRAILGDLNLTAEQKAMVSTVVPRHLRALAG